MWYLSHWYLLGELYDSYLSPFIEFYFNKIIYLRQTGIALRMAPQSSGAGRGSREERILRGCLSGFPVLDAALLWTTLFDIIMMIDGGFSKFCLFLSFGISRKRRLGKGVGSPREMLKR